MSEARRKKSSCSQKYASSSAVGYKELWTLSSSMQKHVRSLKKVAKTEEASFDFPETLSKSDREYLIQMSIDYDLSHKIYGPKQVLSIWHNNTTRKSSVESSAVATIPEQKMTKKESVFSEMGVGQKRVLDDTYYKEKSTLGQASHGEKLKKVQSDAKKDTTRKRFSESCASANGFTEQKWEYEGQEHNKVSSVSKRKATCESFVESCTSPNDITVVTMPEEARAYEGFVVGAVDYGQKRVFGVICYDEKSSLAKESHNFLPCGNEDICMDDLDWHSALQNFPCLGTIKGQGDYKGLQVFGIGRNHSKRKKACRIGLTIAALWKGYFLEESQHQALRPLIEMAFVVCAAELTIVINPLSTISGKKVEAKSIANSVSAASVHRGYNNKIESNAVRRVLPPPPPPPDVPKPPLPVCPRVPLPPPPPHQSVPATPLKPSPHKQKLLFDEIDDEDI